MEKANRDIFAIRADNVNPSKNDVFVLRIVDIVNILGIAREVQKNVLQNDFNWNNYSHMEDFARYVMGVLEKVNE